MYLPKSRFAVVLDMTNTRPADVLTAKPLKPEWTAKSAALEAACRKHDLNDPKCSELGWKCTPLALETYGCWGAEGNTIMSCHSSGHTYKVYQVPGHCFHLWHTQPHFGEVLCKGSAVKSWTFIGHRWVTFCSFIVSCVSCNDAMH